MQPQCSQMDGTGYKSPYFLHSSQVIDLSASPVNLANARAFFSRVKVLAL
jgi:hypothetical protein